MSLSLSSSVLSALNEAVSGVGGTIFSCVLVYPVDLVKTRLQLPNHGYKSMTDAIVTIVRDEGVWALYRGLSAEIVKGAIQIFIYLLAYDVMKQIAISDPTRRYDDAPLHRRSSHHPPALNKRLRCFCYGTECDSTRVRFAFVRSATTTEPRRLLKLAPSTQQSATATADASPAERRSDSKSASDPSPRAAMIAQSKPPTRQLSMGVNLTIGVIAGCITQLIVNPLSVVQTRIMTAAKSGDKSSDGGVISTAIKVYRSEGVGAFFTGIVPAFILTTNPAIQYAVFDRLKALLQAILAQQLNKRDINAAESFIIGALAKIAATIVTYPYIMAKLRMQYDRTLTNNALTGAFEVIVSILRNEGIMGLYSGLRAQLFKSVLGAALMFMAKEKLQQAAATLFAYTVMTNKQQRTAAPGRTVKQ